MIAIGIKNGLVVCVQESLIAQVGMREILERFDMVRRYPVVVDLSGRTVMVDGDSHEDAIQRYLSRKSAINLA